MKSACVALFLLAFAIVQNAAYVIQKDYSQNTTGSIKLPVFRQTKRDVNDPEQNLAFARAQRDYAIAKWGRGEEADQKRSELHRRQTAAISDYGYDSFYWSVVTISNQNFNLVLDTGSSDLWVADSSCTNSQCQGIALFNPSASTTYRGSSTPFQITYGSGAVRGTLAADTVSLAGYTVFSQTFAVVNQLASGTLNSPLSGIMGLGFQSLAQSAATPFWEVLVQQGKLQTNAFTFQLARNVKTARSSSISAGGIFTLGQIDSAQYNGNINYVNLANDKGYWSIPIDSISINGNSGTLSGDNEAAIDTGTTLLIMPPQVASQVYSQIQGARALGGANSGSYAVPCSSNINLVLTFGGQTYAINSADMTAGPVDSTGTYCLGGILGQSLGSSAPTYIIGDVFLKNVFSVFRYGTPSQVGFASLKGSAAQTIANTLTVGGSGSTNTASSATSVATNGPASVSSVSAQSASDLPSPSAASTNSASSPSLTPASGSNSNSQGATSNASRLGAVLSVSAMLTAMAFGAIIAL